MTAHYELQYLTHFGQTSAVLPDQYPQPVPPSLCLNTPIGVCTDKRGFVWVCDTSNNRVLIMNPSLQSIALVLTGPGSAAGVGENPEFIMPFHIVHHPAQARIYLTDIGNGRVCVYDYDAVSVARFVCCFRGGENSIEPLTDPNGITVLPEQDGSYSVMVADEFFHYPGELTNRIVRFSEDGVSLSQFQNIVHSNGENTPLKWPQGLSSDGLGRLYIANTGAYGVYRTDSAGHACDFVFADGSRDCVLHSFGNPDGLGQMNIIRGVAVIGEHIFVPDHIINTVTIYDMEGNIIGLLSSVQDWWNTDAARARSFKSVIYTEFADRLLVGAYGLAASLDEPGVFYVTEPLLSRVMKVRIELDAPVIEKPVELLAELGNWRDRKSQLNVVSCVAPLLQQQAAPSSASQPLPFYLRFNPAQRWYQLASRAVTSGYRELYDRVTKPLPQRNVLQQPIFTIDAGNWSIKRCRESDDQGKAHYKSLHTLYMPGDLSIAGYLPKQPLLGQICPGTPVFLVANYTLGVVRMYQYSRWGQALIPYGLPIGLAGAMGASLRSPMGMTVSASGDLYIASSMDNAISHWRILQTGQVVHLGQFGSEGSGDGEFRSPTDVAIDARGRLFVTDQNNNRIQVFDADGNYLWQFGTAGYTDDLVADAEKFLLPVSLCIEHDMLVINDLVNRALKVFHIGENNVEFVTGARRFGNLVTEGRLWMPFYIRMVDGYLFVPDCTLNVVNVFRLVDTAAGQQAQDVAA